ncbi:MAG TPA: RNA 2',3'-cyclic phosphodiesterase [Candidatus Woesebacteria bacterium]|nr:RNA 2',3'-cyclic phosphodiesterase [Candidatus Woesebacteria bacterium]
MRTFLAIDIPNNIRQDIIVQTAQLRKDYPNFNWVPSENFHITVHFIGDIPSDKLDIVSEHIERTIFDIQPTYVYAHQADLFIYKSITAYIGMKQNKTLSMLNKRFVELFEDKKEEYKPHITLAKWKIPSKQQYFHLKKKLQNLPIEIEFPVTEIHLYESISKPKNPEYNIIKSFKLEE